MPREEETLTGLELGGGGNSVGREGWTTKGWRGVD